MTPRRRRMISVAFIIAGVSLAVGLALQAFQTNLLFFYSPTQIIAGEPPMGQKIRLGGLVLEDSFVREPGSLEAKFIVTDLKANLTVYYEGVLPDLFREGQGVVAHGFVQSDGSFIAAEILAKHDENYMSPEVKELLDAAGHPSNTELAKTLVTTE